MKNRKFILMCVLAGLTLLCLASGPFLDAPLGAPGASYNAAVLIAFVCFASTWDVILAKPVPRSGGNPAAGNAPSPAARWIAAIVGTVAGLWALPHFYRVVADWFA